MSAPKPRAVADLVAVTGLAPDIVRAYIRAGMLPGYFCRMPGAKRGSFVIPAEAFDRFCRGEWVPAPRPVSAADVPERPTMLHRREAS